MKSIIFCTLAILALITIGQSKLQVSYPEEVAKVFDKSGITAGMANFGYYRYGHSMTGVLVVYANKKRPDTDGAISYDGCDELSQIMTGNDIDSSLPFFLMVDRGECKFITKAKHAANIGAKMLIVADNQEDDIPENHLLVGHQDVGAPHLLMPTIMISKKNADKLKELAEQQDENGKFDYPEIRLNFKMDHPSRSEIVKIELFSDPLNIQTYRFLKHFRPIFKEIGSDNIKFIPRYYEFECKNCKKHNFEQNDTTGECISGGRYCAKDPDGKGALKGQDVVYQQIRSLCAYQTYGQNDWIDATIRFYEDCVISSEDSVLDNPNLNFIQTCYVESLENTIVKNHVDTDENPREFYKTKYTEYEECISNSYVKPTGKQVDRPLWDNILLREERERALELEVEYTPMLFVNKMRFYGDLEATPATEEIICEAFKRNNEPNTCKVFDSNQNFQDESMSAKEKESYMTTFAIILLCIPVIIIFLWILKAQLKKTFRNNMQSQVNESVNRYFSMADKTQDL